MSFTTRLRRAVVGQTQIEREHAYLSHSTSLTDLERRQREIDRGVLRMPRFTA